jgi:very-short-patch-repair endonuclease
MGASALGPLPPDVAEVSPLRFEDLPAAARRQLRPAGAKRTRTPRPPSDGEETLWGQLRLEGLVIGKARIALPVREYRFAAPERDWRFDFAWPAYRIAVEVEGGTWSDGAHTRGKGYEEDLEKYNDAVQRGWRVLRFTTAMVMDGRAMADIRHIFGIE